MRVEAPALLYRDATEGMRTADLAVVFATPFNLDTEEEPVRIMAARVSDTYFPITGPRLALGRAFTRGDEAAGSSVAVVSHEFWQQRMSASPSALGRTISFTHGSTLHSHLIRSARTPLRILMGAVGVLLLIVLVNLSGLPVRGVGRTAEWVALGALGARRFPIARQTSHPGTASLDGGGGSRRDGCSGSRRPSARSWGWSRTSGSWDPMQPLTRRSIYR